MRMSVLAIAAAAGLTLSAAPGAVHADASLTAAAAAATVRYRTADVDGVRIFYREAGRADAPVIVLLHGFPSSSHMFRSLIPQLAGRFRVIAPDYPGFGQSDMPSPARYAYTFDNLAKTMGRFLETVGARRYTLYLQDYGGPVGFRIATAQPERVTGLVIQNANAYVEGFGADTATPVAGLWEKGRSPETDAPARQLYSPEGIRLQYVTGARDPEALSPDAWALDSAYMSRPGQDDVQLSLLENYKCNLALYPEWQAYLRKYQPKTLIVWGKNDPIFIAKGAEAYLRDLPQAQLVLLDTGHFALEEDAPAIAAHILKTFGFDKGR